MEFSIAKWFSCINVHFVFSKGKNFVNSKNRKSKYTEYAKSKYTEYSLINMFAN